MSHYCQKSTNKGFEIYIMQQCRKIIVFCLCDFFSGCVQRLMVFHIIDVKINYEIRLKIQNF